MATGKSTRTYDSSGNLTGGGVSADLSAAEIEDAKAKAKFQDARGLGAAAKRIAAEKKPAVAPGGPESLAERAARIRKGKAAFDAARAEADPR